MEIKKIYKESYPFLLKQISQLPEEMEYVGNIPSDEHKFLCVIGSRTNSSYGKDVCSKLIDGLSGHSIVIVSGMAVGIDSLAHEAALKAGLKTVAFPGSGLSPSVLYPYSRRNLAQRIVESGGALISKFPSNMSSQNWTFPTRNRLMAGISHAVLIIEAREGSGTLGTAQYATDFNRDILAVPGSIFSDLSYGPHMLLADGATPITCSEDILEALDFAVTRKSPVEEPYKKRNVLAHPRTHPQKQLSINLNDLVLSPEEKTICQYLKNEKMSATDLIEKTSWSSSLLSITISELEMKSLVMQEGGSYRMRHG